MLTPDETTIPSHQLPGGRPTNVDLYNELVAVRSDVRSLRAEVRPVLEFHQRVLGVLAVARWMGPIGLLGAIAGMWLFLVPH